MTRQTSSSNGSTGTRRRVDPQRLRRTVGRLPCQGRILLVDDDRHDLDAIRLKLGIVLGPGVEVLGARTVRKALDIFATHKGQFDLLLLNYMLKPQGTGIELLGALQDYPRPYASKAVLYSGRMDAALARTAAEAGFNAAVATDELDSMSAMSELLWRLVKPDIDWSASWRGLP